MSDDREVASPRIPEDFYIAHGHDALGLDVVVARGICECNETSNLSKLLEFVGAGTSETCPDCGRIYVFDGEGFDVIVPKVQDA